MRRNGSLVRYCGARADRSRTLAATAPRPWGQPGGVTLVGPASSLSGLSCVDAHAPDRESHRRTIAAAWRARCRTGPEPTRMPSSSPASCCRPSAWPRPKSSTTPSSPTGPGQPDALHFMGVLRHAQGDGEAAVALIREAIAAMPEAGGALEQPRQRAAAARPLRRGRAGLPPQRRPGPEQCWNPEQPGHAAPQTWRARTSRGGVPPGDRHRPGLRRRLVQPVAGADPARPGTRGPGRQQPRHRTVAAPGSGPGPGDPCAGAAG